MSQMSILVPTTVLSMSAGHIFWGRGTASIMFNVTWYSTKRCLKIPTLNVTMTMDIYHYSTRYARTSTVQCAMFWHCTHILKVHISHSSVLHSALHPLPKMDVHLWTLQSQNVSPFSALSLGRRGRNVSGFVWNTSRESRNRTSCHVSRLSELLFIIWAVTLLTARVFALSVILPI
jgi:hypothetical protein